MARGRDSLTPSIKAGCIGEHIKKPPMFMPMGRMPKAETTDRETGRPGRYVNPPGFIGLHGGEVGKNWWEKTGGRRETKTRTDASPTGLKGEPFDG